MAVSTENPFLVITVVREILTLLAIFHLEIAKNLFAAGSAEQLNSPQGWRSRFQKKVVFLPFFKKNIKKPKVQVLGFLDFMFLKIIFKILIVFSITY